MFEITNYFINNIFMNIAFALFITLGVELLITTIFFFKDIKVLISLTIGNILLNLTMNMTIGVMPNETAYYIYLLSFELFTTLVEAIILIFICNKRPLKSFLVAILANGVSLGVGLLINHFEIDIKTKMILTVIFALIYAIVVAIDLSFYLLDKNKD